MAHIKLENVTKTYPGARALSEMSLDIADGEFFVLLGPTGAGKTTTLRLIAGLDKPTDGTVRINGEDVVDWTAAQRDIALVFQYYSLYPRYTVRQNLEFPLKSKVHSYTQSEIDTRVDSASKILRIDHLLDRKTDKLSGGEMQRVAIGRAIVREPRAFLMDEPLSNLDAKLRESLRSELKDLQMKLGATFLFVTHDQIEAMSMGDKIGVLNQGRIEQVGTPHQIYNNPRDVFVAGFVGSPTMNLVDGTLADGRVTTLDGKLSVALGGETAAQVDGYKGPATIGIRAEDVAVGPEGEAQAKVHHIENHGVEQILTLRVDDHLFKATTPATFRTRIEDSVRFSWAADKVRCFDPETGISFAYRSTEAS
ncbi:ABC transporter ATP-binding protein [Bauldia sp.]|uniref:ABC transporter ATP-binding protein n=1 Tax=Bauldia sp. TaxID=2575872 RepID=UPI003BAA7891